MDINIFKEELATVMKDFERKVIKSIQQGPPIEFNDKLNYVSEIAALGALSSEEN